MHLIGESPEDSLPNQAGLGVLQSQVVFVIGALRVHEEVVIGDEEPEGCHCYSSNHGPALEPSLRINVIKSPIRVSLKRSGDREPMRTILLGHDTEGVDDIRNFLGHLCKAGLLEVVVPGIEYALL